jgi:hypothetical protein
MMVPEQIIGRIYVFGIISRLTRGVDESGDCI